MIGAIADIRKAFQMLKVREEDQHFVRFLWWEDESCLKLVIYQHLRVVFGDTYSPFLLAAALQLLFDEVEDEMMAKKLKGAFYCDNLVTSVSTASEYGLLKDVSMKVLASAKMDLRQWACSIVDGSGMDLPETCEKMSGDIEMPVLGLIWNRQEDTLSCVIKEVNYEAVTKRNILSALAQVFDPMGFLSPALILPKLLVQQSWLSKLGWDDSVSSEVEKTFLKWNVDLGHLKIVKVPRYNQVLNATTREVHVFCDSSQTAMASVAFLKTEVNGEAALQFLLAKSRLTPVKKSTIPRAELVSCVVGARVAACIKEALEMKDSCFTYWSDSTTALSWIRRSGDWGVFVKNRVDEILRTTSSDQWRHVPGCLNPADLPSRGCTPSALLRCKWWEGPTWLLKPRTEFPEEPKPDEQEVFGELKKVPVSMMISTSFAKPYSSSYRKNVAVWGWVLRFVSKLRGRCPTKEMFLSLAEMRRAEKILVQNIQAECFPVDCSEVGGMRVFKDADGLIRVKTRLTNRDDTNEFIYPLLLPKNHPLVQMLVADIHRYYGHGGVQFIVSKLREKYWIIQSRRVVRKVVWSCVGCRRHTTKRMEVDPASLPSRRVDDAQPFATTGVDLAGPLVLKDGAKAWIVLYTCALYRAVHLDLVTSLSTEAFVRSLECFICLYGRPNTVYSDNGTNFVGASNLFKTLDWEHIQQRCGVHQIQWIFNPPTAAWWGGFWERLVRSVKDLLKRMLGRSKLSYDELRTCLAGVSSTINDRPLTLVTEDNDDLVPLTPAMFLRAPVIGHFPELESAASMQKSYRKMKDVQLRLQHRFRREYLSQLVTKVGNKQWSSINLGDVVLVGADNRKRFEWPLGRGVELIPGKDGKIRVVRVRTSNGVLLRPLQRIYPLELSRESQLPENDVERDPSSKPRSSSGAEITRSGREVRQPVRYGRWNR